MFSDNMDKDEARPDQQDENDRFTNDVLSGLVPPSKVVKPSFPDPIPRPEEFGCLIPHNQNVEEGSMECPLRSWR
jgi:hypothetical protein